MKTLCFQLFTKVLIVTTLARHNQGSSSTEWWFGSPTFWWTVRQLPTCHQMQLSVNIILQSPCSIHHDYLLITSSIGCSVWCSANAWQSGGDEERERQFANFPTLFMAANTIHEIVDNNIIVHRVMRATGALNYPVTWWIEKHILPVPAHKLEVFHFSYSSDNAQSGIIIITRVS